MIKEQKAKEYNRNKIVLEMSETLIFIIFLLSFMIFRWSSSIKIFLSDFTSSFWLLNGLYSLILFMLIKIFSLPLAYISNYHLEHKYQLSTQTFYGWMMDELKGLALLLIFSLIIVEIIYGLMFTFPRWWWLVTAVILSSVFIIIIKVAPILFMPIFFKFHKITESELENRLLKLTEKANTRINGIFKMELSQKSKTANAALAGMGRTRRIILSDTLLDNYTYDEIEAIMAHELGHHVHNHLWKGILLQSLLMLVLFQVISVSLKQGVIWFKLDNMADIAGLPYLIFISLLFSLILLPLVNSYLRHLEYQSDQYGVAITGKKEAFIKALEKLGEQNLCEKQPNPIIEFIFYSHPSIQKRIEKLSRSEELKIKN